MLIDVIRSKDAAAAESLMREHIAQSTKNYLDSLSFSKEDAEMLDVRGG
jgi:DNA-binding GntR family transcriptional regulator